MDQEPLSNLAEPQATEDDQVPAVVVQIADGVDPESVWRNELGGLTFRIHDRFVKWNPPSTGVDLDLEHRRLDWMAERHPVPRVLRADADSEAQWHVTAALPGGCAVGDTWRARRSEAIQAIAEGLRAIHAIPTDDVPESWALETWVDRVPPSLGRRPAIESPVLVHGDACAPNTLIDRDGAWTGNVDFGDLAVGDRWADLAIASMSLDWNFGEGHQPEFFDAYGIEPDRERIRYYRKLWDLES